MSINLDEDVVPRLPSEAQGLIPSPTRLSNRDTLDFYLDVTHRKPKLVNKRQQGTDLEEFYPKLKCLGETIQ